MTSTSKVYGNYVVFVESKALRGRSKQEVSEARSQAWDAGNPGVRYSRSAAVSRLPMVLTRDEVHQLLGAVRENRFARGSRLSITAACVLVKPCGCGQRTSRANVGCCV